MPHEPVTGPPLLLASSLLLVLIIVIVVIITMIRHDSPGLGLQKGELMLTILLPSGGGRPANMDDPGPG